MLPVNFRLILSLQFWKYAAQTTEMHDWGLISFRDQTKVYDSFYSSHSRKWKRSCSLVSNKQDRKVRVKCYSENFSLPLLFYSCQGNVTTDWTLFLAVVKRRPKLVMQKYISRGTLCRKYSSILFVLKYFLRRFINFNLIWCFIQVGIHKSQEPPFKLTVNVM